MGESRKHKEKLMKCWFRKERKEEKKKKEEQKQRVAIE